MASEWRLANENDLTTGLKLSVLALNFWGGQGVGNKFNRLPIHSQPCLCKDTSQMCRKEMGLRRRRK